MKPKVVLGLSGGVDSALCARLLMEDYAVIALYLSIGPDSAGEEDARRVAGELGIPFHVMDISRALEEHVKTPFAADYLSGRTPLPCVIPWSSFLPSWPWRRRRERTISLRATMPGRAGGRMAVLFF